MVETVPGTKNHKVEVDYQKIYYISSFKQVPLYDFLFLAQFLPCKMEKKIHKVEVSTLWFSAGGTVFIVQNGKQNFIKWKLGTRPLQKVLQNMQQTQNSSREVEMVIQRMGRSA